MKRPLLLIAIVALAHAAAYIGHMRPDWDVAWTDQGGYKMLGEGLARTGTFTRYPDAPAFVPEVLRTPGYPVFVAAVYRVFGVGNDLAVVIAQAFVFAALCLLVYALARRVADERLALGAAALTALYPPLPHFGALVLTELWTTFAATGAMLLVVRAAQDRRLRDFALAGVLLSATTLVRPVFILLPFFLAVAVPILVPAQRDRRALAGWAALALAAALTMVPWFAYNYVNLGRLTLSPAGGIGRGLWEGAWQGRWPGRVQATLTAMADTPVDTDALDAQVRAYASETGHDAALMLDYVHEWRDIRAIWDTPTDPFERARARIVADDEYLRAALVHIRQDPLEHVVRRATRGTFVLWAAETPIRYTLVNELPTVVIRAIWLVQVVLLLLAVAGIVWLTRMGRWLEAVLLTLPLVYVTVVHLPLLCEARQSLPVKPLVLILATLGAHGLNRFRAGRERT
ncbi:MAG: glycosyltransferase family 39 protein [Vicinamibacterales bacterium]|nr:glycosyltransferase family 39 protein [Vicinamibacterales bacterium]